MAPVKKEKEVSLVPTEVEAKDLQSVMAGETEKRKLLKTFIGQHMVSGTDYGTIKFGGKESKPSLFKPGSEKFLSLFKLTAKFDKDTDTWEMAGSESGVFAYKCTLLARSGEVVGEGRGVAKLSEKAGWTINNAVKIAEKRAQIDAVLRTGALSDFFTQDLEDMAQQGYDKSPVEDKAVPTVSYDDHEAPRPEPWKNSKAGVRVLTEKEKNEEIKRLAEEITLNPFDSKESYWLWIEDNTGLKLSPKNLDAILAKVKEIHG